MTESENYRRTIADQSPSHIKRRNIENEHRARTRVSLFLTNVSKPLQKPTDAEDSYEKVEVNLSIHVINIKLILQNILINFIAKERKVFPVQYNKYQALLEYLKLI